MKLPFYSISEPGLNYRKPLVLVFFALYFLLGLFIYKDYGMSWDEHWGRENGVINAKFMAHKLAPSLLENKNYCPDCKLLTEYPDADHGPVFEIATTFLEWVFGLETHREIFYLRHLCSFLLFYVSAIFFYLLLQERFRMPLLSLAGVIMLIASPRIFAETFFNAKDIPFLSMIIISVYTLNRYLRKRNISSVIWHALACGITIDIRILGLLIPAMTVVFSLLDLKMVRKDGQPLKKTLLLLLLYIALLVGFIIMFWPILWEKPFLRFPAILARSSNYPWTWLVLYLGESYPANKLPWHYLPVWIFISTPLFYSILALGGLVLAGWQMVKSKFLFYRTREEQLDLAMAGILVIPIIATIILKLVLYDGWRHMFFIHAGLIYMAVLALAALYRWFGQHFSEKAGRLLRYGLIVIWLLAVGKVVSWMIIYHPFQNVYFSVFSGEKAEKMFERDYWGLSYRQGLLFVLQDTDKPLINVNVSQWPGVMNAVLLPPAQQERLHFVSTPEEADYFLTEYRWHGYDYPFQDKEVYHITVDGMKIMSVFRLK